MTDKPETKPAITSLLAGITEDDIRHAPFPHIVIRDALPQNLYDALAKSMPTAEYIGERIGKPTTSNKSYNYVPEMILAGGTMTQAWKEFVPYHFSPVFYEEFPDLFQDLLANLPDAQKQTGPLHELRVGRHNPGHRYPWHPHGLHGRHQLGRHRQTVCLPRAARRQAVQELFSGLFCMRLPEDDATERAASSCTSTGPAHTSSIPVRLSTPTTASTLARVMSRRSPPSPTRATPW
jgi:hypothetical protein